MRTSYKKFKDILDKDDLKASIFFKKHAKNILKDEKFLRFLLKGRWSERKYDRFRTLAWVIMVELNGWRGWGYKKHFNVAPICEYFCDYMRSDCFYMGIGQVPFEKWEDIARKKIENLKVFIEKNQMMVYKRTKLWKDYCKRYMVREEFFERTIPNYELDGYPSGLL